MIHRRSLLLIPVALVIAGMVWLALRPAPEPVSLAVAERGHLAVTIEEEGRTRVRERYDISAPVDGWAPRITLEAGDRVSSGEVLVALEPTPAAALDPRARAEAAARVQRAQAALEAEQARLEAARATAEYARAEHERLQRQRVDDPHSRRERERGAAAAPPAAAQRE
ncbi:MAG: efflux transporter periplasmic adaptor subunit, partial [Halofilum sp. (in: g-proteobacteria)]|nr:efflux transporter periplasmic adaptor subunit [Halofilum sp. (in: g-proteobacteria)]